MSRLSLFRNFRNAVAAFLLLATLAFPVSVAAAYDPFKTPGNDLGPCAQAGSGSEASPACQANGQDPLTGPNGAISSITTILATVAGIISVIFLVWGGYKYITSNGDSAQIATAKNTIIYSLVGIVVAALARPLVNLVISGV